MNKQIDDILDIIKKDKVSRAIEFPELEPDTVQQLKEMGYPVEEKIHTTTTTLGFDGEEIPLKKPRNWISHTVHKYIFCDDEPEFNIENLDIILKEFKSLKTKGHVLMIGTPKE